MEKYFHFDRSKTLKELDGQVWNNPDFESHLITTCYELRQKPVGKFSPEDIRMMIGQQLNLDILVPMALEALDDNILVQGDFYPGDILEALLRVKKEFWKDNSIFRKDLEEIIQKNIDYLNIKLKQFQEIK